MADGGLSFRSLRQPVRTSAPAVNVYTGRPVSAGRITEAIQPGQAFSSLGGGGAAGAGLAGLARGFGDLSEVLYKQEEERQKLEAIEKLEAAQDEERGMFEQMSQMTGSAGYAAPQLAEPFYKGLGERLDKEARGDFQRKLYAGAVAQMRDQGLNKALAHRLREHEAYKNQVYTGSQDRLNNLILANPANYQQYTAQKQRNLRELHPGAAPEWLAMESNAIANGDDMLAYSAALVNGDFETARNILQKSFTAMPTSADGGPRVKGSRYALPTDNHHYITSPFGARTAPQTPQGRGSSDHKGVDFQMPVGTPVRSISGGTVEFAGDKGGYGMTVVIKHDDGTSTSQYAHLSKLNVQPGARVQAGAVIAASGNSGKSTGPHLDLRITENGAYIDPAQALGLTKGGQLAGQLENTLAGQRIANEAASSRPIMLASLGGGPIGIGPPVTGEEAEGEVIDADFVVGEEGGDIAPMAGGVQPLVMPPNYGGRVPPTQLIQMQKMWNAAMSAQAKQEAAELKRRGEEAEKDLIDKWFSPEGLNQDDVVAVRDYLSPDDYKKYLTMSQTGAGDLSQSGLETLLELQDKAINRTPDFQESLKEAVKSRRITYSDYNSLSTMGEKYRLPVLKQAEQIIKLSTGRSELNPNPAADLSYLYAMQDFEAWLDSDSGQKASDRERLDKARELAHRYRIIESDKILLGVPAPSFLVGTRTAPDIPATIAATRAAKAAGQLTDEQYFEEADRINKIQNILLERQAKESAGTKSIGDRN